MSGNSAPGWNPEHYDPGEHTRQAMRRQAATLASRAQPPTRQLRPAAPTIATRRRKPFPRRLTRFPWQLMPLRSRSRRGRSVRFYFWYGRHWIAALIMLAVACALAEVLLAWMLVVIIGWALWCAGVTVTWLAARLIPR